MTSKEIIAEISGTKKGLKKVLEGPMPKKFRSKYEAQLELCNDLLTKIAS